MEPNNRNNRNRGDKNRRRGGGMWSIVLWALLLTIGVNYLSVMLDQARTAESSCEIAYSELVELVEEGKVKSIEFGDTVFTITPVDGFTYTDDDGKSYDQNYTLFTTIIPDATENLITLCDEHGVTYTKPYQPPVSPILTFMVSYILPTVLMVGAFMLLMNFITKKSGGMGGIGGIGNVGKANAKVYMEKSTGVTFADVAGQDEAKESLVEIIDFLHNPEKYTAIGAKIPKGFDPSKGVIVLAATNRPEVLDKALLRPGRFDRRITVDRPNLAGRLATLQVHTRGIKLAEDVDLKKVALATAGCVGADLANLANEAALRAVRKGRKLVTQEDMLAAFEFVIAGSEKKGSVLTEFEKKLVAYHEVGHAMVAYKQKNAEPVQKITIVPHTEGSLGYTLLMPEEDKTNLRTRDELMAKIAVSMGGRAAEEVVMNTMTNGASQDIQEATSIARNMVAMYGMSDAVGMVALGSVRNQYLDGGYGLDCAQDTAAIMDREVKRILDECYKDAVQVIRDNREDMDKVVAYLLEKETITGGEMVAILEGRDPSAVEEAYASTRKSEDGFRPSQPSVIEAPAKHISMTSEKIEMPPEDKGEDAQTEDKPSTEPETPDAPQGEAPDAPTESADENK